MNNFNDNEKELRSRLIALLYVFEGKPHLLANYLLHYDVFDDEFKNKILENNFLKDVSDDMNDSGIIIKPYFTSMQSMQDYYSNAFQHTKSTKSNSGVLKAENDEQALLLQLRNAVEEQEFERAAKIKQYMEELGYKSSIF